MLDIVYLTDTMSNKIKSEWIDDLYATAKANGYLNRVVIATYIKCLYNTDKHDAAVDAFLYAVKNDECDNYVLEAIAKIISLGTWKNSKTEETKRILDAKKIDYRSIKDNNILLDQIRRITRNHVGKWSDIVQLYESGKLAKKLTAYSCNEILFYIAEKESTYFRSSMRTSQ